MTKLTKKYIIPACVLIVLFLVSCNPRSSYPLLSFFFDGIEKPRAEVKPQPAADSSQTLLPLMRPVRSVPDSASLPVYLSAHPDYQKKACAKCHQLEHGFRLRQRQPQLCYQCHTPFETQYTRLHGPVAAGFCLVCHEPHKSKYTALAKMPVQQICRHCHEAGDVNKNEAHKKTSAANCLQCHNAHGGETAHFLKKD